MTLHAQHVAETTEPKEISAKVVVPWLVLQACAAAERSNMVRWHQNILKQFCLKWLRTVKDAGGYYCPACGELWANLDAAHACIHVSGLYDTKNIEVTLRKWMEEA